MTTYGALAESPFGEFAIASGSIGVSTPVMVSVDTVASVANALSSTTDTKTAIRTNLTLNHDLRSSIANALLLAVDSRLAVSNELVFGADTRATVGNEQTVTVYFDTLLSIRNALAKSIDSKAGISNTTSYTADARTAAANLVAATADSRARVSLSVAEGFDTEVAISGLAVIIQRFDTQVRVSRSIDELFDTLVEAVRDCVSILCPADIENIVTLLTAEIVEAIPSVSEITAGVWGSAEGSSLINEVLFLSKTLKNKREVKKVGAEWKLLIYADDGVTPILSKPLKDFNGAEIADLASGVLAQESASSV